MKLDDQFFRNPKAIEAGRDARALYLAGLCHCASGLTDGFISTKALAMVASDAGVKVSQARVLERLGLWQEDLGGWWVHDYLEYNPTAESVKRLRKARAEAGRRGGLSTQANSQAIASANGQATPCERLQPRPVPSRPQPVEGQGQEITIADLRDGKLPDLRLGRDE